MWLRWQSLSWVFLLCPVAAGDDWPQWLGPNRDAVLRESGLVRSIPSEGLPVVWRVPVKYGYSGPAVADGRVFLMDYDALGRDAVHSSGGAAGLPGKERVLCLRADTGEVLWEHVYDQTYHISYPAGPRCTPTVDGERVCRASMRSAATSSGRSR